LRVVTTLDHEVRKAGDGQAGQAGHQSGPTRRRLGRRAGVMQFTRQQRMRICISSPNGPVTSPSYRAWTSIVDRATNRDIDRKKTAHRLSIIDRR